MDNNISQQSTTQFANWAGSIPVILSLAPTSLSSPTMPPPIHALVSRQTYLHIGLESAVLRLHRFAPSILSFASGMIQEEPDPGESQQQEEDGDGHVGDGDSTNKPDSNSKQQQQQPIQNNGSRPTQYPICWFEDEETQMALRWHVFAGVLWDMKSSTPLPWRIRLHFTAYPSSQILPFDTYVLNQVQYYYKNSLKQALCLQYGTQKVAMNVTKEAHSKLWDAVCTGNVRLYDSIHAPLQSLDHMVPIRLYLLQHHNQGMSVPPIQRSCPKRVEGYTRTLGMLLQEWLPDLFMVADDDADRGIVPSEAVVAWKVQGIQPPLQVSLSELWGALCHPDHFCYIVVTTK